MPDGKRKKTYVSRIVLSHSRKGYSEATFSQTTEEGELFIAEGGGTVSGSIQRILFGTNGNPIPNGSISNILPSRVGQHRILLSISLEDAFVMRGMCHD